MTYKLVKCDDIKPTHALVEKYLPFGEIWCWRGFMFVPPELGARLGEHDDAMLMGTDAYPAWSLDAEMPTTGEAASGVTRRDGALRRS